jgi:DnaJ-class molecular chaperone
MLHKSKQKDYYGVLGVSNKPKGSVGAATDKEIKKAYHKLSVRVHPPRHPQRPSDGQSCQRRRRRLHATAEQSWAGLGAGLGGDHPSVITDGRAPHVGLCADAQMKWHPDKAQGDEGKKEAEAKFVEIAEAYEILSDDEKRGKFDRGEEIEPEKNGGGGHNPFQHFQQHFHFQH